MQASLKFNLDDHDDREAHMRCVKALDLALALSDIREKLFNNAKADEVEDAASATISFKEVEEILVDRSIDLNELIS